MLLALRISNFAVIDEAEVSFGPGLSVLTGETGAGKSIVVDALGLILGGRADPEVIRAGAEEAVVEATFAALPELEERLAALGLPASEGELGIRRVVSRAGRGKVHVNGALVTVGVLAQLMKGRVDIAGQHEHVSLFDPALHRQLLDRHGGLESHCASYARAWEALRDVDARMDGLGGDEQKAQERADFLRYQLQELERFSPVPGEDARLEEERRRLGSADKIRRAALEAEGLVSAQDGSALEALGRGLGLLSEVAKLDGALADILTALHGAASELEESARRLSRYAASVEADPQRLAEVDERLDGLKRLCRKHATDLPGLVARQAALVEELAQLGHRTESLQALASERAKVEGEAVRLARGLSELRSEASRRFSSAVQQTLGQLALGGAAFEVRVAPGACLGPHGQDEVEFHFSANRGEPARALLKVASGGEASRVLLALKRVLARADQGGCYVLDEVDAGVSGAVAEVVGRMIKDVSTHHQVLCVTHLPQVAAFADAHFSITKREERGRTVSRVQPLGAQDERTRELARMLSGVEVTREAVVAAEALVRSAQRPAPAGRSARSRSQRQKILQSA